MKIDPGFTEFGDLQCLKRKKLKALEWHGCIGTEVAVASSSPTTSAASSRPLQLQMPTYIFTFGTLH